MTRNVLSCAKCGGNDFEVSYGTDCSRDKKGNEIGSWRWSATTVVI